MKNNFGAFALNTRFGAFALNTKVKVKTRRRDRQNQVGKVVEVKRNGWHCVKFSDNEIVCFRTTELEDYADSLPDNKETIIYKLIKIGNLRSFRFYFNGKGIDPNFRLDTKKIHTRFGSDTLVRTRQTFSLLDIAAFFGHLNIVKFLINRGARVNKRMGCSSTMAAKNGKLNVLKYFINDLGVNIECESLRGFTHLMLASFEGRFDIVKYLVSKGANPKKKDRNGRTAINFAATLEIKKYLKNVSNVYYTKEYTKGEKSEGKIRDSGLGDNECHICLEEYKEGEKIVLLHGPDGPKHHMHLEHMKDLRKEECPLCRQGIHTKMTSFGKCVFVKVYKKSKKSKH